MLRILFISANVDENSALALANIASKIDTQVRASDVGYRFHSTQATISSIGDFQSVLLKTQPNIVHFSGFRASRQSAMIFEDKNGNQQRLSPEVLSKIFRVIGEKINCVFFDRCGSRNEARAISEYVDCVITLPKDMTDEAGINFATYFYQALGYGNSIKHAYDLARRSLKTSDSSDGPHPSLYTRQELDPSITIPLKDGKSLLEQSGTIFMEGQRDSNSTQRLFDDIRKEYQEVVNGKRSVTEFYRRQTPIIRKILGDQRSLRAIGVADAESLNLLLNKLNSDISELETVQITRDEAAISYVNNRIMKILSDIMKKLNEIYDSYISVT